MKRRNDFMIPGARHPMYDQKQTGGVAQGGEESGDEDDVDEDEEGDEEDDEAEQGGDMYVFLHPRMLHVLCSVFYGLCSMFYGVRVSPILRGINGSESEITEAHGSAQVQAEVDKRALEAVIKYAHARSVTFWENSYDSHAIDPFWENFYLRCHPHTQLVPSPHMP
jgi:hypothetical protein